MTDAGRIECARYEPFTPRLAHLDAYVRDFMKTHLREDLLQYHTMDHTFDPQNGVIAVAHNLYLLETPSDLHFGEDHESLASAATLHDFGLALSPVYEGHEDRGAAHACVILPAPEFGYTYGQALKVSRLIGSSKVSETPNDILAKILRDADVANLGDRELFWLSNEAWRQESGVNDMHQWLKGTADFMRCSDFGTESARRLYSEVKQDNLRGIEGILRQLEERRKSQA